MPCCCESSLCDHGGMEDMKQCQRETQGYVKMAFVEEVCATCAANMCATGGEHYIFTAEQWELAQVRR